MFGENLPVQTERRWSVIGWCEPRWLASDGVVTVTITHGSGWHLKCWFGPWLRHSLFNCAKGNGTALRRFSE